MKDSVLSLVPLEVGVVLSVLYHSRDVTFATRVGVKDIK